MMPTAAPQKHQLFGLEHKPLPSVPPQSDPIFLHRLAELSDEVRQLLVRFLLPVELLVTFGIDPVTLRGAGDQVMVETAQSGDGHNWGLRVLSGLNQRDPLVELEITDTIFNRLAVAWVNMNDPHSPRFDIDVLASGDSTLRGKGERNLDAEMAAMVAGLAPGQVRRGLGCFKTVIASLEQFLAALHHHEYEVEPLFYHNAVLFERMGFHYIKGRHRMQRIHTAFLPGGEIASRLNGATPFRDPMLGMSVRGRSWAIHDGILDEPWDGLKLLKRIGVRSGEDTTLGLPW